MTYIISGYDQMCQNEGVGLQYSHMQENYHTIIPWELCTQSLRK